MDDRDASQRRRFIVLVAYILSETSKMMKVSRLVNDRNVDQNIQDLYEKE